MAHVKGEEKRTTHKTTSSACRFFSNYTANLLTGSKFQRLVFPTISILP